MCYFLFVTIHETYYVLFIKSSNIDAFEEFNSVNELEHNSENIILNTKDLNKSFAYEIDEFGEMTNKEPIRILIGQHG